MTADRAVTFRCRSMTEAGVFHTISVPAEGYVSCSCVGTSWCSHIDATLVAGERHMVPREEWPAANRAQALARGRIGAPEGWQASWRKNRGWRGLPTVRSRAAVSAMDRRRPLATIIGRGAARREMEEIAQQSGWSVTGDLVLGSLVLVAPDADAQGRTAETARRREVPVISYDLWRDMASAMGEKLTERLREEP